MVYQQFAPSKKNEIPYKRLTDIVNETYWRQVQVG